MKTRIFTLPVTSLDMPHLAVPTLVGFLKAKGFEVSHVDLTAKAIKQLLNKTYIEGCYVDINSNNDYGKWLRKYGTIGYENIDSALSYFRNEKTYSRDKYYIWSYVLSMALAIVSYKYDSFWTLKNIQYNCILENTEDYIEAVKHSKCNIFHEVFANEMINFENDFIDVVGMSITYEHQLLTALHFAKMIKEKYPHIKIILGGSYISHLRGVINEFIHYDNLIDIVILNNGQNAFSAVIESLLKDNDILKKNCDIEYQYKNRFVIKEKKCLQCSDFQNYIPDFSNIDIKAYLSSKISLPILTSYGCYHGKCTFCTHFQSYGDELILCDIDRIKEVLLKYYFEYGAEVIYFVDECISPERLGEISKIILDNNINIEWIVETRIDKGFNRNLVELMEASGCKLLSFGIETVIDKTLKHMNKGFLFSDVVECISEFRNTDIAVAATMMVGYPWEMYENSVETLEKIENEMELDFFGVSLFGLHKNSILFREAERYGLEVIKTGSRLQLNYDFNVFDTKYVKQDFVDLLDEFHKKNLISNHFKIISRIIGRTHLIYFIKNEISFCNNRDKNNKLGIDNTK